MLAILQQSIAALSLSDVDGERLFFHKNIERSTKAFATFLFAILLCLTVCAFYSLF